ncbi:MAG TPA: GAF domain-containing sensor histidine kinase [Anaerolineales bacterium]|nr:GAF domain-containing sensor histidine kinase [Anaerolineales bacterium]
MADQDVTQQVEELRQLIVRLSRLVEVSVTLNSTLEPEPLLQFLIGSAADLLDSEAASILLFDDKTQRLYFAASTGADPAELRKIPVPLEGSIAGTIYRDDSPLIINEVAADPRHYRQVGEKIRFEARTLIGVPMRMRERRIGVLEALNKRGGPFTENDLQTLSIIASQAAVAIHNANLVSALQKAYDELGKVEKLKSDFIAIASHELRTPLGVILGYAALLKEDADQATSEHAAAVLNSALRMRALIEDMTNMNMLRVGSAELAMSHQPLQPILESAYQEMRPLIEAKGQQVTRHTPAEQLAANVDAPKMTMALTNLLNNAMRFTPGGGRIEIGLERHGGEAWMRVRDNGVGMPADQLERVFDQFYQVEHHMTRRHEGMGLGLSIVRAVVRAHNGRVWAESPGRDQGATFTIALPLVA